MMKFLIIGDPLEGLSPETDTGLTILRSSLQRGHQVFWATPEDVVLSGVTVGVFAVCVLDCAPKSLPQTDGTYHRYRTDFFDAIWIRKDPPMDWKYISLCWLLSGEEAFTPIVNPPSRLIQYHEKMIPFRALRQGYLAPDEVVSTYLVTGGSSRLPNDQSLTPWITKPWLGHGGRDVQKWESLEEFESEGLSASREPTMYLMLQRFLQRIHETGDRRIFFIHGEYMGDFVRMPPQGHIEANLVRGGTAELRELTEKERDVILRLGQYLKEEGIIIAGADMIDEKISEVNITAPTGFETLYQLKGIQLGDHLVQFVERLVQQLK